MKQYGVSHLLVLFQSHARLCSIRSFNEDQLVSLDVLQDALQTNKQKHKTVYLNILTLAER